MKKAIVAGANGFLGKNLTKNLCGKGYEVTALGRQFDGDLLKMVVCVSVEGKSIEQIAQELKGEYFCFYDLAWMGTTGRARADCDVQIDNIRLTCDYVKLASMIRCPRVIYASSINEMETYEYLQADGGEPAGSYIYGAGKLAAHLMGKTSAFQNNVEFISVVITNIYGAGEKSGRLICTSVGKLLKGEHCSFTAGHQIYDFIYITDAVNAIVEVAEKGKAFHRYYIGSGEPKPLREFLLKMRDIVSPEAELGLGDIPFKGIDINYNQFNLKKVERDTGYKNKISFEEGIRMTKEWMKFSG